MDSQLCGGRCWGVWKGEKVQMKKREREGGLPIDYEPLDGVERDISP